MCHQGWGSLGSWMPHFIQTLKQLPFLFNSHWIGITIPPVVAIETYSCKPRSSCKLFLSLVSLLWNLQMWLNPFSFNRFTELSQCGLDSKAEVVHAPISISSFHPLQWLPKKCCRYSVNQQGGLIKYLTQWFFLEI